MKKDEICALCQYFDDDDDLDVSICPKDGQPHSFYDSACDAFRLKTYYGDSCESCHYFDTYEDDDAFGLCSKRCVGCFTFSHICSEYEKRLEL